MTLSQRRWSSPIPISWRNHGFHNDTTPRYDKAAADLAWERTLAWFNKYLR
ncbi:dienelactone hydrolase family protein [Citrobacter sp.]|uniref:dienelactone hydrolase family protein n=1 Tax=Citrobacter sp. TaxID=1896336 RepID=UPI002FC6BAF9